MPSSDGSLRLAVLASWFLGSVLALAGVIALATATPTSPRALYAVVALAGAGWAGVGGYGIWRVRLRGPAPDGSLVTLAPGRTSIGWYGGPRRLALAAAMLFTLILGAVTFGFALEGAPWVLPAIPTLAIAVFVPDLTLQARRRAHLTLTLDGVEASTADADVTVAWADVVGLDVRRRGRWSVLHLTLAPGASSLQVRSRPRFVWRPRVGDAVEVPFGEVHLPAFGLIRTVDTWRVFPASRRDLGTTASVQQLLTPGPTTATPPSAQHGGMVR